MNHLAILFAPLLPREVLIALGCAALLLTAVALLRGARGAWLRGALFALMLLALLNPSLVEEQRTPIKDTVLIAVDESASMRLGDRTAQTTRALDSLAKKLSAFDDVETDIVPVKGGGETNLFAALAPKLASLAPERLAGIIALSDGEIHDTPSAALPAPFHLLIAGQKNETDLRLIIKAAPAYGLVGKKAAFVLRVEDAPGDGSSSAAITLRRDDASSETFDVPVNEDVPFEAPVAHAGANLFAFSVAPRTGEITSLNNSAAASVNGIRDRLRVLLVSGAPHIGGRTWRNFLKADPAVDLVHFTILRSPAKADFTPNNALSLIAFPARELFETKLHEFDLVILDRFRPQSLVPDAYLENIARYVEQGGSLLVSSATDEGVPPLALSPLARILPAEPTGKLLTGSFVPDLTATGRRHPVTASLEKALPRAAWGPWLRLTEARARHGDVLMSGTGGAPLLVLAHAGEGRVAQFLSDQFWLWARDYCGERWREPQSEPASMCGGPQAELLRRVAHWLVKEPELDETALRARAESTEDGWSIIVEKRELHADSAAISVVDPENVATPLTLAPGSRAGILQAAQNVQAAGLYRVRDDQSGQEILVMAGPGSAAEFGDMRATDEKLRGIARNSGGGIFWLADNPGAPDIKRIGPRDSAYGWNWLGLRKNGQYRVTGSKATPLWPPMLLAASLLGLAMLSWRREGES